MGSYLMIVSENNVHDSLAYLAIDPHPIAEARYRLTMAENNAREVRAKLFTQSNASSVAAKEASVECHEGYREAKNAEAVALMEYERHRSRVKAAEALLDIWRSENANARAAEKVR